MLPKFLVLALAISALSPDLASATPVLERVREKAQAAPGGGEGGWKVREQAWQGVLEPGKGRAVRLQLFRGKEYMIVFGVEDPAGVASVGVLDRGNRVVARSAPVGAGELAVVTVAPEQTGTYLVLLRADALEAKRAGAMVYSYR